MASPRKRPTARGTATAKSAPIARQMLSIVIPVFNEAANIAPLIEALVPVLDQTGLDWEVVFVNDGSTDDTAAAIRAANSREARIRAIGFSRNFGKEIAIAAGLDQAVGDAVVIMDADLQHPPATIAAFLEKWREGYQMVYGQRSGRETESAVKRYFAERFYQLFARFGETPLPPGAGDFRLIDRRAVEAMKSLGEKARFSKGLYAWVGFKSIGVPFHVGERMHGQTKFNYPKLFRFAFDGISSFSTVPLKITTYLGVLIALAAIGVGLFFMLRTLFFGTDLPGFPSLIVSIMFFSGIQLVSLGLIGEYVGRIFAEVKRRPLYLIDEVIGAPAPSPERQAGVLPPSKARD